jgi:hypothetical protein
MVKPRVAQALEKMVNATDTALAIPEEDAS